MDPFSLTVGLTGLAGLAAQTVKLARRFIFSVKSARGSIEALVIELEALRANLEKLDLNLRSEKAGSLEFPQTSVLRSTTSACETQLTNLHAKLQRAAKSRAGRLIWPFDELEHRKLIQDLRSFSQWMHFGLSIDGCALLSRTSKDVTQILQRQLTDFDSIRSLECRTAALENAIKSHTMALTSNQGLETRQKVFSWVSDYPHDQKHDAIRSKRVDGTGTWLLERTEYMKWRDELIFPNVLWCHGIQGSGKSTLASLVIDELAKFPGRHQSPIAYVYFDYRDQESQTPSIILASILKQMLLTTPVIPEIVNNMLQRLQRQGSRISQLEAERVITDVVSQVPSAVIVVDALDECDGLNNRKSFLETLAKLRNSPRIRIFITSRSYSDDIRTAFQEDPQILISAHDADIRRFLSYQFQKSDVFSTIDEQLVTNITEKIARNAQGMFLLPVFQIRTVLKEPTPGGMEDALNSLFTSLPDAFEGTITRICQLSESRKDLALQSLMWICHAKRPLVVWELSEVLAVGIGQKATKPKYRPSPKVILDCCQGLVAIDDETNRVRFVHYAVQEYLHMHSDRLFPLAQSHFAATCLTYLLFDAFQDGPCESSSEVAVRVHEYPFLMYASRYMGLHAVELEHDQLTSQLLEKFMCSHASVAVWSQTLRWGKSYRFQYWSAEESYSHTALHVASCCGLKGTVDTLLEQCPQSINVRTAMGSTPLILASSAGHGKVVQALLQNGADPYLSNWYGNALHCAAEAGSTSSIQELLCFGTDINLPRRLGRTALHCTVDNDNVSAASMLIHNGAIIDARDDAGMSVLHVAASENSPKVLHLLLQSGQVDLGSTSKRGITALHYAAEAGNRDIVETLLEYGADVKARDAHGQLQLKHTSKDRFASILTLLKLKVVNCKRSTKVLRAHFP